MNTKFINTLFIWGILDKVMENNAKTQLRPLLGSSNPFDII